MNKRVLVLVLLLTLGLGSASAEVAKEVANAAATMETKVESKVSIDNFTFNPAELKVKVGTTVIFENGDDIPHSIVEIEQKFHSPPLDTGEKYTMTFDVAGEINYACGLHPHMKGKIIVTP